LPVFKGAIQAPLKKVNNAEAYYRILAETSGELLDHYIRMFVLPPGGYIPLHKHRKAYHLQLVLEGVMRVVIGGEEYEVRSGDAIYVPPGTEHSYTNIGEGKVVFICLTPKIKDETIMLEQKG